MGCRCNKKVKESKIEQNIIPQAQSDSSQHNKKKVDQADTVSNTTAQNQDLSKHLNIETNKQKKENSSKENKEEKIEEKEEFTQQMEGVYQFKRFKGPFQNEFHPQEGQKIDCISFSVASKNRLILKAVSVFLPNQVGSELKIISLKV